VGAGGGGPRWCWRVGNACICAASSACVAGVPPRQREQRAVGGCGLVPTHLAVEDIGGGHVGKANGLGDLVEGDVADLLGREQAIDHLVLGCARAAGCMARLP
jgi:hypothetical protein